MKHVLIALWISAFILLPANAQPRTSLPEEMISRHVEMMTRHLELSEEQATKVKEILTDAAESGDMDFAAIHESVQELLTDEQRAKVDESMHRRMMAAFATRNPRRMARTSQRQMGRRPAPQARRVEAKPDSTGERGVRSRREAAPRSRMDTRRQMRSRAMWQRRGMQWRQRASRTRFMQRGNERTPSFPRLNTEQREAVEVLRRELERARRTFSEENPDATPEEARAFGAEVRREYAAAMDTILTAEQQLLQLRLRSRSRSERSLLNLSEDQETQVKAALAAHREATGAWRDNNPEATREEQAEQARAQYEALQAALGDILTPQQLQRLERIGNRSGRSRRTR